MLDLPRLRKIEKGEYEIVGTSDIVSAVTDPPYHYIAGWEVRRGSRELCWGTTRREALERYMKLNAPTGENNDES